MKKTIQFICVSFIFLAFTTTVHSAELLGVDIHGFISQGYLLSSDNNFNAPTDDGTFEFNEFGINFSKELTDKMRVGMQFFAKDLGSYGNDEITLDWAYGDYRWKDWLGFRAGKVKTPHGLYNETRDVDMLRSWIFLPQSVYSEVTRDATLNLIGGGLYGNIDMHMIGALSYQALIGTQHIEANESLAQTLMGITYGGTEVNNEKIDVSIKYVFGLEWETPLDGLRVAGSYSNAEMDLVSHYDFTEIMPEFGEGYYYTDLDSETYVVSAEYTWNNLLLAAEYTWSNRRVQYSDTPEEYKPDGWYFGGAYRFTDWFELGGYYSAYYADRNNRSGSDDFRYMPEHRAYLKDICLSTRFDINDYWTIKLEGHLFDGSGTLGGFDNPAPEDGSDQFEDEWHMFAAKLTYSF